MQVEESQKVSGSLDAIQHVDLHIVQNLKITESTKQFVLQAPFTRLTILGLVLYASEHLQSGTSLLDVGAGDCPYKNFFAHVTYKSTDFGQTGHTYNDIDYFCLANDIPVDAKSFDAILCTEVLEHVPNPQEVLAEFNRVLKNGGQLFATVPFVYPMHEAPYDFYRYTLYALRQLLQAAGFDVVFVTPRGGWIASIVHTFRRWDIPLRPQKNVKRLFIYCLVFLPIFAWLMLAVRVLPVRVLAWLDKVLDTEQTYTAGYAFHARKIRDA
jgi:SAM-dependent methyltransferase